MSVHMQRYSPDTCQCVLLETWDDTVDAEARIHTFHAMEVICAGHAGEDGVQLYQRILHENRRKNLLLAMAQSLDPTVLWTDYHWSFDPQRCLLASFPTLDATHLPQLQAFADLQFGPGLVRLL